MDRTIKIAGATLNQTPLDWEHNFQNIVRAIESGKSQKVDLLCLPELCITGYGCEDMFLSDWVPAKALEIAKRIIPYCENITVIIGLPLHFESVLYNTALVVQNNMPLGFYAKKHMALDGVHYEPRWFSPWPKDLHAEIEMDGIKIPIGDFMPTLFGIKTGFEICEDAWRKDTRPAHDYVKSGIELILNPSASHFAFGKTKLREDLVVSSSQDFKCVYVFSNLLGNEGGRMIYDGEILIAQKGKLLAKNTRLSFSQYELLTTTVNFDNPAKSVVILTKDTNNKMTEFPKACGLGLFDYLRKSKSNGFVISLSGGADSATCAVMVSEMVQRGMQELGFDEFCRMIGLKWPEGTPKETALVVNKILITAYQGTKNSAKATYDAAKGLAKSIGAQFYSWEVDKEVESYTGKIEKALDLKLTWEQDDTALQNIQARARSPIIWMIANLKNMLLITTSNRSEGAVGYTTMDGDTSGSIAPIAAVDKDFIKKWITWAADSGQYPGLVQVAALAPSAELRPGHMAQTDEDDLMPYDLLLAIEKCAIRDRKSPVEVFKKLSQIKPWTDDPQLKSRVIRFFRLWSRNQWKRERIAPSFHLDEYNVDPKTWCRFPILSGGFEEEIAELENL